MSAKSVNLIRSKVTIYQRERSALWQARIKLKSGEWYRITTGTDSEDQAREAALKFYYTADYKEQNKLPQSTRKFAAVAQYAITRMQNELDEQSGKIVYKHYIAALKNYIIPFFGKMDIANIGVNDLKEFNEWRDKTIAEQNWASAVQAAKNRATNTEQLKAAKEIKKKPFKASQSTINTHNSALNRVFDEALLRGWITTSIKPVLLNKGVKAESRGAFTPEEYKDIYTKLRAWSKTGRTDETKELRQVLREYVLILANTGIRHGTEAANLKWKHIAWYQDKGERYLTINVDGKRGKRELVARDSTTDYLDRLRKLNPRLTEYITLDALIAAKVDEFVLVGSSGKVILTNSLAASFRQFLNETSLLMGADDKPRSLYSLRHTYATFALADGRNIHKLAVQMGTSVGMLEKYYSKVSARLNAKEHSGRKEKASVGSTDA
jgi:integrase